MLLNNLIMSCLNINVIPLWANSYILSIFKMVSQANLIVPADTYFAKAGTYSARIMFCYNTLLFTSDP